MRRPARLTSHADEPARTESVSEQVAAVRHRLDLTLRPRAPLVVGGPWRDAQQRVEEHVLKGRGAVELLTAGASDADRDRALAAVRRAFDAIADAILEFTPDLRIGDTVYPGAGLAAFGFGSRDYLDLLRLVDGVAHSPGRNPTAADVLRDGGIALLLVRRRHRRRGQGVRSRAGKL